MGCHLLEMKDELTVISYVPSPQKHEKNQNWKEYEEENLSLKYQKPWQYPLLCPHYYQKPFCQLNPLETKPMQSEIRLPLRKDAC